MLLHPRPHREGRGSDMGKVAINKILHEAMGKCWHECYWHQESKTAKCNICEKELCGLNCNPS